MTKKKENKVQQESTEEEVYDMKCGIEIHQQLDTNKLFCECPSILRQEEPQYKIKRKLHVVAGEGGIVDKAAIHEAAKDQTFIYEGYRENTCLVDADEEPPHEINPSALRIAMQVAILLNCEILPLTQIMRKTVINGSNTSGFQRTVLIARGGYVETPSGRVGIEGVCLEEDSARTIKEDNKEKTYRLDRLGIPLVEIATAPEIKTPEQAKEVALFIGEVLRASKVKRGIGTIRQDVNVSASVNGKWGKRVEIKGVQEVALIEKTINTEIERQKKLIVQGLSVSEVRRANPDGTTEFLRPMPGAARMYPETDLPLLRITREEINESKRTLPKLKSEMRGELTNAGLSAEMIKLVLDSGRMSEFQELIKVNKNPNLIAKLLILWPSEIAKKKNLSSESVEKKLTIDILETILVAILKGKLSESNAREALNRIIEGKEVNKAIIFDSVNNLDEEVLKIIKSKPGLTKQGYMGIVMAQLKGRASGKEVMEALSRLVN
jgi:Glu-tRNA(Gln) amidotransferase subunit E-like FAD-binding protein